MGRPTSKEGPKEMTDEIDYRELLKKYICLVGEQGSIDFIPQANEPYMIQTKIVKLGIATETTEKLQG